MAKRGWIAVWTLLGLLVASAALAKPASRVVSYKEGTTALEGYFAYDDEVKGKRPLVLVFHEWWGHGPNVRARADELAKQGYVAFAVDMYGKGVTAKDHETAGKLAGAQFKDRALMRRRAQAALDEARRWAEVDAGKIAAVGYCFGGAAVLELARSGADIRGAISVHGILATPVPATETPKAKLLVLHGAEDAMVNGQLADFMAEMRKVKANWELVQYGGAVHSFSVQSAGNDPSKGMAYDAQADARSWARGLQFLHEVLQ